MTAFIPWFQTRIPDSHSALRSIIPSLLHSISEIAVSLRTARHVSLVGTANAFGDDQLNVDVTAENIIRACLATCPSVVAASSEEDPVERPVHASSADSSQQYAVAFDPLDGSSIIAPNWSVGTIIGIWQGASALLQVPSRKQIASILGVYGPRTTAIVAVRIPGTETLCFEIGLSDGGVKDYHVVRESLRLSSPPFSIRYFAPANLRAAADDQRYLELVTHFIQEKYTLRYSGGLVPDVVHTLVKGQGVYLSPVTRQSKAKLRKLFELFPVALVIEAAGGKAIDPLDGSDILSRGAGQCDERGGLVCGNVEDVELAVEKLSVH
ncbi:uncharacterized protein UV8b_05928 [Ustilaginoidea virens]|uniref:Uncharacterized protein n=1 Tax=Ustilaginoidea virens TaxID=1159556 RepID=A0A063BUA0_USTVR|nr:uncharacterized protein UV8b_05928 [Ustilaginoidea virens]QUC21685.1 hypothetical protein UV8b_05928 [Ustilaginoidea virens]GAO18816.1 hypothetical protein UVI_02014930 [Ustilaginoidea virens]